MNDKEIKKISKRMSLALRHKPDALDLQLDEQGWTTVDALIKGFHNKGIELSLERLQQVVSENNKKRFTFNEDGTMIRANQGHSINIDLGFAPTTPPPTLFHGTATRFLNSIKAAGLEKRSRQHVHLSADKDTASQVGKRHGKLVILIVRSAEMQERGFEFYLSKNGVWLTDHIPAEFIDFPKI